MDNLSKSEFMKYAMILEQHHSVFYRIISFSELVFDKTVEIACVRFYPENGDPIQVVFNPDYWNSLSVKSRCWIIAHEMWHVINQHGKRIVGLKQEYELTLMNKAMDIVVHYALENSLGMDREEYFPNWKDYCFLETIFPDQPDVLPGQNAEYYYCLLKNKQSDQLITWNPSYLTDDVKDKIFEKLSESMSNEEKKELIKTLDGQLDGGKDGLGSWLSVNITATKILPKWETIIKKWVRKQIKEEYNNIESWVDVNKRLSQVFENTNIFLPFETEKYIESQNKNKNKILFFLDASGSVYKQRDRFFKAVRSVPKKRFDVELASFDTQVYKLNIDKPVVRGGGGTSFSILETYIQKQYIPEHGHYPDCVFLITDGYGDSINPQYPNRWYWFMTEGNTTRLIPKESHKYNLKDFS